MWTLQWHLPRPPKVFTQIKKENWRFSITFFFIYLAGTFNLVILNFIKISRVLNFAILRRWYFTGFYFRDFEKQIFKRDIKFHDSSAPAKFHLNFQSVNFWRPHEIYPKEFVRIKRAIKMKMRAGLSAPYAKSLRMNVISEKKKKNRSYQYIRPVNDLCIC